MGKFFGEFLFTTCIALAIAMIGVVSFTAHDNLKPVFAGVFEQAFSQADPTTLDVMLIEFRQQCVGKESVSFMLGDQGNVTIGCNEVNKADANMKNILTTAMYDKLYYKQYSCSFIDCVKSGDMAILMSAQGNAFFRNVQIISLVIGVLGAALILISAETWPGRLKGLGIPMIFLGLSYFLSDALVSILLPNLIPTGIAQSGLSGLVESVMNSVFEPAKAYFLYFLIAGVAATILGYVLGYIEKKKYAKSKGAAEKKPMIE